MEEKYITRIDFRGKLFIQLSILGMFVQQGEACAVLPKCSPDFTWRIITGIISSCACSSGKTRGPYGHYRCRGQTAVLEKAQAD